jgi:uncharacterized membrane protein (DUF441 family)
MDIMENTDSTNSLAHAALPFVVNLALFLGVVMAILGPLGLGVAAVRAAVPLAVLVGRALRHAPVPLEPGVEG